MGGAPAKSMLSRVTAPPSAVSESWEALTDPVEVDVVEAANSAEAASGVKPAKPRDCGSTSWIRSNRWWNNTETVENPSTDIA